MHREVRHRNFFTSWCCCGNIPFAGKTNGLGGPSRIGVLANPNTLTDELAQALENVTRPTVPLLSNFVTDAWTDINEFNEFYVDMNLGLAPAYEETIRRGAEQVGCTWGKRAACGKGQ